jgi:hypothetical protein
MEEGRVIEERPPGTDRAAALADDLSTWLHANLSHLRGADRLHLADSVRRLRRIGAGQQ